jgi:hypothetical protein
MCASTNTITERRIPEGRESLLFKRAFVRPLGPAMDALLSPALASLRISNGDNSSRRPQHSATVGSPQLHIGISPVRGMLPDEFSTPCATPPALEEWLLEDPPVVSQQQSSDGTPRPTLSRPGSAANHSSQSSCTCAICLSPVRRALSTRRGISFVDGTPSLPRKMPFRTQCCGQLFHRSCLAAFKEQADGNTAACPLCRSERNTGLTPLRQPTPQTGFVGASSMRSTMRARASAARLAVQRGLSARTAAEQHLSEVTARAEYTSPALSEVDAAFHEALVAGPWIPANGPSRSAAASASPRAAISHANEFAGAAAISATAEWRAARYRHPSA